MTTFWNILAGFVAILSWLTRRVDTKDAMQRGADNAELEARRKLEIIERDADAARNSVLGDDITADPNNRRKK